MEPAGVKVSVGEVGAKKLRHEDEHLDALRQMQRLRPYYEWVYDMVADGVGRRILDAGCGVGNFTALLAAEAELVIAADLSERNLEVLRHRFRGSPVVEPMRVDLDELPSALRERKLDTVACLDVLEHVEDDHALLARFRELVVDDGRLVLKVPALPALYGSIDRASDHFRRYSRGDLVAKVRSAGWEVMRCQYMNVVGVLPYWLKSRVLRRRINFSRTFSESQLDRIARAIPWLRRIDRCFGGPWIGQSLVLVAQRRRREAPGHGG